MLPCMSAMTAIRIGLPDAGSIASGLSSCLHRCRPFPNPIFFASAEFGATSGFVAGTRHRCRYTAYPHQSTATGFVAGTATAGWYYARL